MYYKTLLLLSCFIVSLFAMEDERPIPPSGGYSQHLMLEMHLSPEEIFDTYRSLFLSPFENLMFEGKVKEAREQAKKDINTYRDRALLDYGANIAVEYKKYSKSKDQATVQDEEKFQPFYFRLWDKDNLIAQLKDEEKALNKFLSDRLEAIEFLDNKGLEGGPTLIETLMKEREENLEKVRYYTEVLANAQITSSLKQVILDELIPALKDNLLFLEKAVSSQTPLSQEAVENLSKLMQQIKNKTEMNEKIKDILTHIKEDIDNRIHSDQFQYHTPYVLKNLFLSLEEWEEFLNVLPLEIKTFLEELGEILKNIKSTKKNSSIALLQEKMKSLAEYTLRYEEAVSNNFSYKLNDTYLGQIYMNTFAFVKKTNEILETDPDEYLTKYERLQLEKMEDKLQSLKEDTRQQVNQIHAKINFINKHPDFFEVQKPDRIDTVGLREDQIDLLKDYEQGSLGTGSVVGVIDFFDTCLQTSSLLKKILNQEFRGSGSFSTLQMFDDFHHGLHVGGIIASDDMASDGTPVGIAPGAYLYLIDQEDIGVGLYSTHIIEGIDPNNSEPVVWDVNKHIELINLFSTHDEGQVSINNELYEWNKNINIPTRQLGARLFNLSLAASVFSQFGRGVKRTPEFVRALWLVSANRHDNTFIFGLGNDGLEIASSPTTGRSSRALANSPLTHDAVLFATNLMEDGMTLHHTSNVPGDDIGLQQRTLSAVGTNVESTLLQKKESDPQLGIKTGTSMAAPKVTAIAADILSLHPDLSNEQLSTALLKGATPLVYDPKTLVVFEIKSYLAGQLNNHFKETDDSLTLNSKDFLCSVPSMTPTKLTITKTLWNESQRLFGQGRINLAGALQYVQNFMDEEELR